MGNRRDEEKHGKLNERRRAKRQSERSNDKVR